MNIYLITNDKDVADLATELPEGEVIALSWEEQLPEIQSQELNIFILDFDEDPKKAQGVMNELRIQSANVVFLSGRFNSKQIRDHQSSPDAADAYIGKPLDLTGLSFLINDFQKSWTPPASPFMEMKVATAVRSVLDITVGQSADFNHPLNKKIQAQFDAVFREADDFLGETMGNNENATSPTLAENVGDLELGDDLDLDLDEGSALPEAPIEDEATETGSDMELSLDEELTFDENAESVELSAEEGLGELDLDATDDEIDIPDAPPAHSPTETKIKMEADDLDLDLDLGEEIDAPPEVPEVNASSDLEAELLDESSGEEDFTLSDVEEPASSPQAQTKSFANKKEEKEEELDDDILGSIELKEPSLNSIKNEDSVKFYRGDENPIEKVKKGHGDLESQMLHETMSSFDRVASSGGGEDLVRMQTTLRHLRAEREQMLKDLSSLKTEKKLLEQDNLGLKAEIDELKIELSIVKKRHNDEVGELRYQARVSDEKKALLEEKVKTFQKEFDRINQKVRVDINQVKQREKELEGKLELMAMDSSHQIQSRDNKILELKRKIDALEFNMENISIQEQKAKDDKTKVEERLRKIVKTLRGSIKLLEDDIDLNQDFLEEIKKM